MLAHMRISRNLLFALALGLVASACSGTAEPTIDVTATAIERSTNTLPPRDGTLRNQVGYIFPDAPEVTNTGELAPDVQTALDDLWTSLGPELDTDAIVALGESDDVRLAWLIADLMRFVQRAPAGPLLTEAAVALTGIDLEADPVSRRSPWQSITDHLIAWDLPAPPDYREYKGRLFTIVEPAWQPFFDDENATIDWRLTSWGGVRIDNRPLGDTNPCQLGCIPALDDPPVTDAAGGSWYPDDRIVFGVVVDGKARAYPKNQMEVHEMVNDTLGGRRIGIPYCTLCGSAQAYFTDSVPEGVDQPVLRTTGLLTRSNKVMYDLNTFSIFNTFTGEALTGPLREQGIVLEQTTVVTSTWADWKKAHPDTTIVTEDAGRAGTYPLDPLGGRDDNGPIFPVGDVDPRLPAQSQVVGVITPDGSAIAFPVDALQEALTITDSVELEGITIRSDGGGFVAMLSDGSPIAAHQSFWFAWTQFHPDTAVWTKDASG
jgi:hypothetical protein